MNNATLRLHPEIAQARIMTKTVLGRQNKGIILGHDCGTHGGLILPKTLQRMGRTA